MKTSQCASDGGATIIKIIEIERKINIQFECVHVKTKQDSEVIEDSYGKKLVLACDDKAKEEGMKCKEERENDNVCARGNVCFKHRDRH